MQVVFFVSFDEANECKHKKSFWEGQHSSSVRDDTGTKEADRAMHIVHGRHPHTSLFYNNSILDIEVWLRYLSNSELVRCSICNVCMTSWHDIDNVDGI